MSDAIEGIVQRLSEAQLPSKYQETLVVLKKICGNVAKNPTNQKFRVLKKENAMIQGLHPIAREFLLVVGWEETSATFLYPMETDLGTLAYVSDLLDGLILSSDTPAGGSPTGATKLPPKLNESLKAQQAQSAELAQIAADRKARYNGGYAAPAPAPAARPAPAKAPAPTPAPVVAAAAPAAAAAGASAAAASGKKGPKSAFDFERRTDREKKLAQEAEEAQRLRDLRKQQYQEHLADPNAAKSDAYKKPPSTANGADDSSWFSGWFGGSSSSNPPPPPPAGGGDRKPRMKTINDLPPQPRRGG